MLPGATPKWTVAPWASVCPAAPRMPPGPAGTVMVSDDDGTRGAGDTKAMVVGVTCCQVPATGGVRVGTGEWAERGTENWTETVALLGTPDAPSTGFTATMLSGRVEAAGWADGAVVGVAETLPLERLTTVTPTATATTATTAPTTRTRRQGRADVDRERDAEWEWEPDITGSPPNYQGGRAVRRHATRPSTGAAQAVAEVATWAWMAASTASICPGSVSLRPSGPRT